jgi:5-methylcytosine-specific restriction endonuclease McrA
LTYLREGRKIAWRIASMHASSLGLHPIIYFYTLDGRHKPASFYAVTAWIMDMTEKNSFNEFMLVRLLFENLLLKYDYLVQDINRRYRQVINSYEHIKQFYVNCIKLLNNKNTIDETVNTILSYSDFNYLKIDSKNSNIISSEDFTDNRKSSVVIMKAIPNALTCEICKGFIDPKSITIDHITDKKDGGKGMIENAQIAHPYCNSTFKDYLKKINS